MLTKLSRWIRYNRRLVGIAASFFICGALLGGMAVFYFPGDQGGIKAVPLRESGITTPHTSYTFIDPLIGLRGFNNAEKYTTMQKEVSDYIAEEKQNGLQSASVDFRDISVQGGFVINPNETYTPASLNKVPVMMAFYKLAESKPGLFSQQITYTGAQNSSAAQEIKPAVHLVVGQSYSIGKLIEYMIRYSDNNSTDLLTNYLKDSGNLPTYIAVFSDLGVDPSVLSKYTDNMTVRNYSMFLRALYNATYLNRTDSEKALQMLSQSDFSEGIESGVPNNTLVAEKFGEATMTDVNGVPIGKEIHNCGIVYYPQHPYMLCIMTKASGDNIPVLEGEIAKISRIIYQGMQRLYP